MTEIEHVPDQDCDIEVFLMGAPLLLFLLPAVIAQEGEALQVPRTAAAEPSPVERLAPLSTRLRFGVHVGLNATAAFDVEVGRFFYGEVATQLTGLGAIAAPHQGLVVSAFVMAGATVPLVERSNLRVNFDAGAHFTYAHAYPVNLLVVGVAAGLRLVHASGFTFAFKLPLVGYAGSPDVPRGGLLYYYTSAIPTVPVVTFGYSF